MRDAEPPSSIGVCDPKCAESSNVVEKRFDRGVTKMQEVIFQGLHARTWIVRIRGVIIPK